MISRRLSFVVAFWVALLAGPGSRRSPIQKSDARDRLEEGSALYRKGDYQGALRKFEQARALFPSAKIYFNLGQAYSRLGRPAAAVDAFERFLDEATDADPARRADATKFLDRAGAARGPRARAGARGSEVAVDGRPAGVAPLRRAIPVEPGSHQVTARAAGQRDGRGGHREGRRGRGRRVASAGRRSPRLARPGAARPSGAARDAARGRVGHPLPRARTVRVASVPPDGPGAPSAWPARGTDAGPPTGIRRWWPWAAGAAAVVVAGVVTTVMLTSGGDEPDGTFPTRRLRQPHVLTLGSCSR